MSITEITLFYAVLASQSQVLHSFFNFFETRIDAGVLEKERQVLQKLLRRLLEICVTKTEAREIFKKAVVLKEVDGKRDGVLDGGEMGGNAVWYRRPEHFSMKTHAAIIIVV